MFKLRRYYL